MATTFKFWSRGKPLDNLLVNTSSLAFWTRGGPVSTFGLITGGTIVHVERISLTLTPNDISTSFGYTVVISAPLSLTVSSNAPRIGAGLTEEVQVDAVGSYIVYTEVPGIRIDTAGALIVYSLGTSVIASAPLLSLTLSTLDPSLKLDHHLQASLISLVFTLYSSSTFTGTALVEAASLTVAYDPIPRVDVCKIGILVGYSTTSPHVVAYPSLQNLVLTFHGVPNVIPVETLHLNFEIHELAPGDVHATIDAVVPLVITPLSPSVAVDSRTTVETLHITVTPRVITISIDHTVIVNTTLPLLLTTLVPVVVLGVSISDTAHLVFSKLAPTILYDFTTTVNTQHLVLSTYVPFIKRSTTALPNLLELTLTHIDPTVSTGARIYETLGLTLSPRTATGSSSVTQFATILHLTFVQKPAVARVSTHFTVDLLHLLLTSYDVEAFTGVRISEVLHLVFTLFSPFISTCVVETPDPLHIIITPHGPGIMPMVPVTGDVLHKERDWAAEFSRDLAQYAERPASALSENFPFTTTEFPNMTVCFWVRFKSFGDWPNPYVGLITKTDCFTVMIQYNFLYLTLHRPHWVLGSVEDSFSILGESGFRFTTGRWYHVGISVESQTGKIYSQVWDDFLQQIVAARDNHQGILPIVPPYNVGSGDFSVGRNPANVCFFDGYLDELVLFNEIRSPMEMDAIRQGRYSGQLSGYAVTDVALQVGYDTEYGVKIASNSLMVGYNEAPVRKVDSCGLMIGYIVEPIPEIPPPPVIGGLAGGGAGEGSIDFCHLSYKFKTELYAYDYNSDQEGRFETYTYPTRHLEASLGSADQGAYFHIMSVLRSGAAIFSAPIWALRSTIVEHARAGQTVIMVDDASNYNPGESMIIMRANDTEIFDLATITSIDGDSIYIQSPLAHHYHPFRMPSLTKRYDERSSYIAPCMTGIVEIEDHGLRGPRPSFFVKVKVDGGAWPGAQIPAEMPTFTEVPLRAAYVAPRIEKTIAGTDDGILQIMAHFSTSRLAFEVEWTFIDSKWKLLRDLFFAAKGRSQPFHLPTWVFELKCLETVSAGSTSIKLSPGFAPLWDRFKSLYATPAVGDPFAITLTAAHPPGTTIHLSNVEPYGSHSFVVDHISGSGFLPGQVVPGTCTFQYECGSPYHTMVDNGEGLLIGPGVIYGHIFYSSSPSTFLYSVAATTSNLTLTASYDYIYQGAEYYECEPLEYGLTAGDKICLYPQVRFLEDELIFEFLDIGKCAAKVSFIEVLT